MQQLVTSSISHPFRQLSQSRGQITHVLLTRSPLEYPPKEAFPLDLHVLSTPPAFVLSQDQTLHRKPKNNSTENKPKPKNEKLAIARIIVRQLKKKPPPQPHQTTKAQPSHGDGIIQTNSSTNTLLSSQKSDAQQLRPVKGFLESWWPPRGRKPDLAVLLPAAPWRQVRTV